MNSEINTKLLKFMSNKTCILEINIFSKINIFKYELALKVKL